MQTAVQQIDPGHQAATDWRTWLGHHFSAYTTAPFADRHVRFWEWVSELTPGYRPAPRVEVWPRGGAKALALDTPLPTPDGWTTMGQVGIGTVLLDHNGIPTIVTGMSAIETKRCYRVTFDDGTSIIASDDHLWSVLDRNARHTIPDGADWATDVWDATSGRPLCSVPDCEHPTRKGTLCSAHAERQRTGRTMTLTYRKPKAQGSPRSAKVMTTAQLLSAGLRYGLERRWAIPTTCAVQGDAVSLPVHPYVLGAWLGDGHTDAARITVGVEDVEAMHATLERCGVEVRRYERDTAYELSLVNGTRIALREAGVLGNKHIPAIYLRASHEQRMSLLRGLLDTDGWVIQRGRAAGFVSNRQVLAEGVRELAHSLGFRVAMQETRAKMNGKDCGLIWRLRIAGITPDVFALPRKQAGVQQQEANAHRNTGKVRYIESIERVEDRPVRCIVVDSPGHLFLAGEGWVPTHNSSSVELGCAYLGSQPNPSRHFVLYVSETQAQANTHVQAIAAMLEVAGVGRAINQYGASKGWTQTRVRTSTGFNVSAFGLDAGMRGVKLDQYRPDVIVFDDIDGRHDTAATTKKKIDTITTSILPAESADCAIIVVQNKIHEDSIVSQLCDGRADFLHDRLPATVEKAVNDLDYKRVIEDGRPRYRITHGTATWEGQDIATCERQINAWGLAAFLREAQQEVDEVEGGLWDQARDIDPFRTTRMPREMNRIVVAIDPNTTSGNDEAGIIVAGTSYEAWGTDIKNFRMSDNEHGYLLEDATVGGGPKAWAEASVTAYHKYRADAMVAEKNNGGDMIALTVATIPGGPPVSLVWASRGKITRAEPVQKLYEDGRIHHVGHFPELEKEMRRYRSGMDSPNRMDACLIAGTRVLTMRGNIPIEDVRIGDYAMTRKGWKPVTNWGMTNPSADVITVEFSDGRSLIGTPNHPIFTHNRGFIPLDTVVWSDIIDTYEHPGGHPAWQAEKTWLNSTVSALSDTPTARPKPAAATITPKTVAGTGSKVWGSCTRRFGGIITALSRTVVTFTTLTEILSTMTSPTLNASPRRSIPRGTRRNSMSSALNTSIASGHLQARGIEARKGVRGIVSMANGHGRGARPSTKSSAPTAASDPRRTLPVALMTGIAVASVTAQRLTRKAAIRSMPPVRFAAHRSDKTSTGTSPKPAPVFVVRSYASGEAPVYNLSVADEPEYYANGVLVHNCVWAFTDLMVGGAGDLSDLDDYYDTFPWGR